MLTVYSSDTCPPCKTLKGWLDLKGVDYTVVNREADPDRFNEIVKLTGVNLVPQVLIDDVAIVGLNIARTRELLGI